jgi:hypothetical protein
VTAASRDSAPVLEEVLVANLTDDARRDANGDGAGREVRGDDGASSDVGLLPNVDPRGEDGAATNPAGAAKGGALKRGVRGVAGHGVVVGGGDRGTKEDIVLNDSEGGEVDVALDLDALANENVIVNDAAPANERGGAN